MYCNKCNITFPAAAVCPNCNKPTFCNKELSEALMKIIEEKKKRKKMGDSNFEIMYL
jgi:hypothetical protein